jgi:hypothetical protein
MYAQECKNSRSKQQIALREERFVEMIVSLLLRKKMQNWVIDIDRSDVKNVK